MARSPWQRPKKRSTKPDIEGASSGEDSGESPSSLRRSSKDSPESSPDDASVPRARRATPRKIALDILARREHSVSELREKLSARAEHHEWEPDEIEAALEALIEDGLLSEERFVTTFVGSYTRRGHGPVWIRAELERRGISGEAIAEALATARHRLARSRRRRPAQALRRRPRPPTSRSAPARPASCNTAASPPSRLFAACAKGTGP